MLQIKLVGECFGSDKDKIVDAQVTGIYIPKNGESWAVNTEQFKIEVVPDPELERLRGEKDTLARIIQELEHKLTDMAKSQAQKSWESIRGALGQDLKTIEFK